MQYSPECRAWNSTELHAHPPMFTTQGAVPNVCRRRPQTCCGSRRMPIQSGWDASLRCHPLDSVQGFARPPLDNPSAGLLSPGAPLPCQAVWPSVRLVTRCCSTCILVLLLPAVGLVKVVLLLIVGL